MDSLGRLWRRRDEERSAASYIPQQAHLTPQVVRHRNGAVEAMWSVRGAGWEDLAQSGLDAQHEALCSLHRTLNLRARLTLNVLLVRTEAMETDYPRTTLPTPFVREMDGAYRHRLLGEGRLYRNHLYLSAIVRPPTLTGRRLSDASRSVQAPDQADLDVLDQVCGTIEADIGRGYGLRRLGLRAEGGRLYSEIAEAHAFVLTGRYRKVPLPAGSLAKAIMPHRPVFQNDRIVELRQVAGTEYAALFGLSVYPVETDAAMFDVLLTAPYRFAMSQSMGTMALHEAQPLVRRTTNRFLSAKDPAATQFAELAVAADELQQRAYGLGAHNLTIAVFGEAEVSLKAAAAAADDHLRSSGAIISRLDWDMEAGYFGMLPGNETLHPRAAPIKTRNFAAFAPMHGFSAGWRPGKWCDHVAVLTTNGGTPFYFNPHTSEAGGPGDVAHMLFTGPNGSGKTTALLWLLAQIMDRAGAQIVLWDKDRGAKLAVLQLGGAYIEIRIGTDTGLAPLKALSASSPADMTYLGQLFRTLLIAAGFEMDALTEHRLDLGLRTVMSLPPALRSFAEVCAFLGTGDDSAAAVLRPWCHGNRLGWVLDNPEDRIRLNARFIAFDQTRYLDDLEACGPIQSYLFHRIARLVDGRRMVVAIDEFQKSLQNKAFEELIGNALATFRKQNCAMWLATQSAATARLAQNIAHTLREQCLTHAHFANGAAQWADFGPDGLGLTERAFEIVTQELTGGGPGRFLLKQGTSYTPVQLSLEGLDDIIATLSGRTENVALMDAIETERPNDGADAHFAEFHRRRKIVAQ